MQDSTRRRFLTMAGTSAVAGVALAAAPDTAGAAAPAREPEHLPADAEPALTVYIRDVTKGELLIMGDGQQATVTDRGLVARLSHAFSAAKKG